MSLDIGWRFPMNDDGEDDDLNNPGVESFKNSPISSLAKEICQNSLDAKNPNSHAAVEVHFNLMAVDKTSFPFCEEYLTILDACKKFRLNNEKYQEFFGKAQSVFSGDSVACLLISDFNTTGLLGAGDKSGTDWYKLTKAVGSSDKIGGFGSFGIGKFAPYANSLLRTVFYSTLNLEGQHAFQGVARLVTHEVNGKKTRGTGYFGIKNKNQPILDPKLIPQFMMRPSFGTNILIAGFDSDDGWEFEVISAVINSFFYAIYAEKLVVKVGSYLINKSNLPGMIEEIKARGLDAYSSAYFNAITSADSVEFIDDDFMGMGRITLKILVDKEMPKRVAMVRGSGMKIFDKDRFRTPLRFAGVFNAEDDRINGYLKSLEPPQHDAFSEKRSDNPYHAKKVLNGLYGWLHESVRSITEQHASEEVDIEGVSKYLPDDVDDSPRKNSDDLRQESEEAASEIKIITKNPEQSAKPVRVAGLNTSGDSDEGEDVISGESGNDTDGGKPSTADGATGDEAGNSATPGGGNDSAKKKEFLPITGERAFSTGSSGKSYAISFVPSVSGIANIRLVAIGEVGADSLLISNASNSADGNQVPISNGVIGPIEMVKDQKISLSVDLLNPIRCAMGVIVNGN